jgi:hypothetical protein
MQACKGLRNIYASAKITLVPIKEMADVLSVESKSVDLSRDSWVRMKLGIYKGDLAKVLLQRFSYKYYTSFFCGGARTGAELINLTQPM